jgi:ubiquinone/menaquinone biosynthesis C-methylase UbiE
LEPSDKESFHQRLQSDEVLKDHEFYQRLVTSEIYQAGDIESAFNRFRTSTGETSYQILVGDIDLNGSVVADLAAGSAPVSKAAFEQSPLLRHLYVVDFNEAELAVAKEGLSEVSADFLVEPLQSLSIPDNSVDVAFCHLGIMLFRPLDSAMDSIQRIIKPGGSFIFNTFREVTGAIENAYLDVIIRHEADIPRFAEHGYGDERTHTKESLSQLFSATNQFEPLAFTDYAVEISDTPETVYEAVKTYYQLGYLLERENAAELKQELLAVLRSGMDASGKLTFEMPFTKVTTTKKQAI